MGVCGSHRDSNETTHGIRNDVLSGAFQNDLEMRGKGKDSTKAYERTRLGHDHNTTIAQSMEPNPTICDMTNNVQDSTTHVAKPWRVVNPTYFKTNK
jgi:hypothetical protein